MMKQTSFYIMCSVLAFSFWGIGVGYSQVANLNVAYPTGDYGSVQTNNEGKGGWEGYSINGRYNFMSSDINSVGIYDDVNNRWRMYWDADDFDLRHENNDMIMHSDADAGTLLYYDNAQKFSTESYGASVSGRVNASADVHASRYCDENGENCIDPQNDLFSVDVNSSQYCNDSLIERGGLYYTPVESCDPGYTLVSCGGTQTSFNTELHGIQNKTNNGCEVAVYAGGTCVTVKAICMRTNN